MIHPTDLLRVTCHAINTQVTDGDLRRQIYLRLFHWGGHDNLENDDFQNLVDDLSNEFDGDPAFASAYDTVFTNFLVPDADDIDSEPEDVEVHRMEPNFG